MKKMLMLGLIVTLLISACSTSRQKLSPQGNLNLKSANVYYQQKNVDKALDFYLKVLQDNPTHLVALKRVADINLYNAEKMPAKAVEYNKTAYVHYDKTLTVLAEIPQLREDEKVMKRDATKKKDSSWVRIFKIGEAQFGAKSYDEASATFETLYSMDTNKTEPLRMLVAVNQELKDEAKVQTYLTKILAVSPNDPEMIKMMGAHYYNTKDYANAVIYFLKTKEVAPRDDNNLLLISSCYTELKQYNLALENVQLVLNIKPENMDALISAKDLAAIMNNNELELTYWKKIIEKDPSIANIKTLCYRLNTMQKYTEMLSYAEIWYQLDSDNLAAVQTCFLAANHLGDAAKIKKYTDLLKTLQEK
jgi:tetratricopeptide (TPR) repeat protein